MLVDKPKLNGDTQQVQAVYMTMVQERENLHFDKCFLFYLLLCFLKEIENMFSVFLSSYRNTGESLGELKNAVETLACSLCSHSISRSPRLALKFLLSN